MYTSRNLPRSRRGRRLETELLETRVVLSSGQGSTFAIMPGAVAAAGQVSTVPFKIDPSMFTGNKRGKLMLGIDVTPVTPVSSSTAANNVPPATLQPKVVSVISSTGKRIRVEHTHYYRKIAKAHHLGNMATSAGIVTLPMPAKGQAPVDYTVQIKGLHHSSGQYLVGFYLVGDANGDGSVTGDDVSMVKSMMGDSATSSNYNFNADINRDGIINHQDLKLTRQNLGASTTVSPVVSVNLDPASDPSLNRTTSFSTVHFAGKVSPDATVTFVNNDNKGAVTTATAGTDGAYNIYVPLASGSNTFTVTTHDGFGQSISGAIAPVVYSPTSSATTTTSSTT